MQSCSRIFVCLMLAFCGMFFTEGGVLPAAHAASTAKATRPAAGQAARSLFAVPFTHYADHQDITAVLAAFAQAQRLGYTFSPEIKGRMSGRFSAVPPDTFLSGMRAAFGVCWYRTGSVLHFYNAGEVSRSFITPKTISAATLYSMLQQSGVLAPQLSATINGGMIVVSGPPGYIAQVVSAANAYEDSQASQTVMRVFALKYAWAEDVVLNSSDKNVTVPGVASILRAMVTGASASPMRVTQEPATVSKLGGTGLSALGKPEAASQGAPPQAGTPTEVQQGGSASTVNIMADSRVNSVLVQDAAYRMPYYEKVIQDLDKPVELVEIHAAIVDVNTDFSRTLSANYQWGTQKSPGGWNTGGDLSYAKGTLPPVVTPGSAVAGAGLSFSTIYTEGLNFFLARVQALEKDNNARVLGKPSVLTVDNVQASLENTTTYYIQVAGYQAVDLFRVDAGTVLRVTPHIIRDALGRATIKLAVTVQDEQQSGNAPLEGAVLPPIKQTRINTQAIVGAEQSLLIGGYYYEQHGTDESGVPILMSVPVLGHLFKTSTKVRKRMERLILITPRIIDPHNLPTLPAQVDDPSFLRSAVQADNHDRVPDLSEPRRGGCSKTTFVPNPASTMSRTPVAGTTAGGLAGSAGGSSGGGAAQGTLGSMPQGVPMKNTGAAPAQSPAQAPASTNAEGLR